MSASKKTTQPTDEKPWYKHSFLWLVIGIPVLAITASLGYATLAFKTADSTIRDDWYMDGKALKQDLTRDKLAAERGLRAELTILPSGRLELSFHAPTTESTEKPAETQPRFPQMLSLQFFHATEKTKDKETKLRLIKQSETSAEYLGQLPLSNSQGKHYVELSTDEWRLRSEDVLPKATIHFTPLPVYLEAMKK